MRWNLMLSDETVEKVEYERGESEKPSNALQNVLCLNANICLL